ncbi:hypothetical protein [Planobispora rosea]|uniref:hypothetical protein n=1 Tax=Planobispora rosea TaxID=35762 RepID=UPI00114CC017|nr:hypothetical protein [Planobispora rosea]
MEAIGAHEENVRHLSKTIIRPLEPLLSHYHHVRYELHKILSINCQRQPNKHGTSASAKAFQPTSTVNIRNVGTSFLSARTRRSTAARSHIPGHRQPTTEGPKECPMPVVLAVRAARSGQNPPAESPIPDVRKAMRILLAILILATTGCSSTEVKTTYHPMFVPVKFEWSPSGIKVSGESSIVTPIGVFSIGAEYALPEKAENAVYVIIRDAKGSPDNPDSLGFDHIYLLKGGSGQLTAVVNGTSSIQVVDGQVLIDVTAGDVQTVEFKEAQVTTRERTAGPLDKWHAYWKSSFYTPFALSRWAYDDSTISSWFGLGFLWFLIRLVVALILGLVDLVLTVACVVAAIAFVLFGTTGQNIVYGLEALLVLLVAFAGTNLL